MDHLDYLPQSNRLAARLGRFDRERVEWLKGFLPPGRTYGPNEKAWLFGIEHAAWAVGHLLREGFEPTAAFQRRFPELLQAPTLGDPDVVREPSPDPYGEPVAGPQPAPMPPTGLSVEGLLQGLERAVHAAFPDRVWVAACLGGLRRQATKGYMTADLVDVDEAGQPGAKLACYISREALARIDMRLAKEGLALAELLPVLVRGRLEVRFGRVQLQLEDLDPAYTVGKTRLSLEQAFAQLDREGLARLQLALPWPELPLRVGLVAGADGEGTRDFRRTLEESGLPFVLRLEAVRMQGEGLEAALVGALGRLAALEVDVIAIVRGGGAGADLHGFNAPGLARAVCTCRRPVLIGIGHDHDRTLLDMVARSQRTPTAAGRHLVDTVAAAVRARELRLRDAFGRLAARLSADRARVEAADRALEAVPGRLERRGEALAATRARVEH
ncbi:MAG: exodeoxyribonuclease VII large subunit, partial [Candidatus Sericytochromatia bacterium]|nr:exodeoxyribonuclease VII large subunit [Candidatus Sericytochromatia bacterium]